MLWSKTPVVSRILATPGLFSLLNTFGAAAFRPFNNVGFHFRPVSYTLAGQDFNCQNVSFSQRQSKPCKGMIVVPTFLNAKAGLAVRY